MIKNFNEILIKLSPDTPLEEMFSYCETLDDFEGIFATYCAMHKSDKAAVVPIPEELKQAVLEIIDNVKIIDVAYIQKSKPVRSIATE